ncbi:tyrosine-type recombinase/integrase [Paenibacillus macerans]|uniref:tyrosine-type recombinase/integrase n=1 Tax=Paenibacillus macerans TaxID=44252 RepID=UPI00203FEDD4|nr:tyrosine-type recombinase/integrase [Paenibacillus macerans]MCM3699670.1 tyrosine-type recombinase/integrase [Paenibacillus macerans]
MRFHDLRHSCASLLLANGVSLKEIQAWLGHSHYSTTANIYVHLEYNSKLSSAQVMSNTLQIPSMQKAPESPREEIQELVHC